MTDITAASSVSTLLRQAAVNTSHEAYGAARTGQAHLESRIQNTSASDFSSDGSFLGSDKTAKNASSLSQVVNFFA